MLAPATTSSVEFSKYMPAPPVMESIAGEWPGLVVRAYRLTAGEVKLPAVPELCLQQQLSPGVTHVERILGTRRQTARLGIGAITFIPANQPVHWRWDNAVEVLHIHISRALVLQIADDKSSVARGVEALDNIGARDALLADIGQTIVAESQSPAWSWNVSYRDSLTRTLLGQIFRLVADSVVAKPMRRSDLRPIQRALNYIHTNLEKELTLQKLASIAHVSAFHFLRLFRSDLDITPHRYIIEQRISRAHIMLSFTGLSISEISRRIGFSSQSHFTRAFHEEVGMTPNVFRWLRTRRARTASVN